jgi:hypothetical protein
MKITISKEQARAFALAVYDDIHEYIRTHQDEFQEYLREQEQKKQVQHTLKKKRNSRKK